MLCKREMNLESKRGIFLETEWVRVFCEKKIGRLTEREGGGV